jgi:hypothetical protein
MPASKMYAILKIVVASAALAPVIIITSIPGVLGVANQIDMRNVSGFANTPACVQDCLYCCHDVA